MARGWYSRGYLPHFDGGEVLQFITLHLGDALPQKLIRTWRLELEREKDDEKRKIIYRQREKFLDTGYGECYLKVEAIAEMIQQSLLFLTVKSINWSVG